MVDVLGRTQDGTRGPDETMARGQPLTLTGLHAEFGKARDALMRVSAWLQGWVARAAELLNPTTVWTLVCDHLKRVLPGIGPPTTHQFLENHASGVG